MFPSGIIDFENTNPKNIEILKRIFRERYNLEASFDHGSIVYKETIARKTEGVGHYEPLRHYAEVHIIVEPAERGSGVTIDADCPEDKLAKNWQPEKCQSN